VQIAISAPRARAQASADMHQLERVRVVNFSAQGLAEGQA
jgi:hypothetical protein